VALGLAGVVPGTARALSLEALFAPKADLWSRWTAHDPAATDRLDHAIWGEIVASYRTIGTDGIARFAYGSVTPTDRARLAAYLAWLQAVPVSSLPRTEQFAYWVNLYNALTVQVVLDHYPVASIRDIDLAAGPFASGPWGQPLVTVEAEPLSLDAIEHRILRPIWQDPRLHYVVNCASLGCPDLPPEPLDAENSERLLEAAARTYVNHPRGAAMAGDGVRVSSIYIWFRDDFGGGDRAIIAHLRRYADRPLAEHLAGTERIAGHDYDWRLNDGLRADAGLPRQAPGD
jgi:hypothetical protein